jgi:hypothetical protein
MPLSSEFKVDPSKPINPCSEHGEPSAAAGGQTSAGKQSNIAVEKIFKCCDCVSCSQRLGTRADTGLATRRASSLASNSEGIGMSRMEQLLKQQQAIAEAIDAETRKDRDEALATVRSLVKRHALTSDEVFMSVGEPEVNGLSKPLQARPTKMDAAARAARGSRSVSISTQADTASEIDALERLATALDDAAAYKLGKIFADKKSAGFDIAKAINWLWVARTLKNPQATDELNAIIKTLSKHQWTRARVDAEVFVDHLLWAGGVK